MSPIRTGIAAMALAIWASSAGAQPPVIKAFTPDNGPPGTLVKIIGERLDRVDGVYFSGVEATTVSHVSDLHLKAVVPPGARTGAIGLINRDGERAYSVRAFEVPTGPIARPMLSLAAVATPSVGSVTLRFTLPTAGHARLAIFDIRGRLQRIVVDGSFDAGPSEHVWNGRDERGLPVPAGLFFARLDADGRTLLRRIVLIH